LYNKKHHNKLALKNASSSMHQVSSLLYFTLKSLKMKNVHSIKRSVLCVALVKSCYRNAPTITFFV
jgi:hypothetical protein